MHIGNIFGHPVNIDLNKELTIIVGENGSGKTKLLNLLNEYFLEHNENVLYFKEDLFILPEEIENIQATYALTKLSNTSFKQYYMDDRNMSNACKYLEFGCINDGYSKILYCLYMLEKYSDKKNLILLFDQPDSYMSITIQRKLISWFKSYKNIKSIFAVTHSPNFIENHFDIAHDITDFVDIYGQKENCKNEN